MNNFAKCSIRKYDKEMEIVNPGSNSHIIPWTILLVLIGSTFYGYANKTIDTFLVALVFLLAGYLIVKNIFKDKGPIIRTYLMTYSICIIAGGMAQYYSLITFNNPQSTIDAVNSFFPNIAPEPPFTSMKDISFLLESCLPIVIWQQIYKITWLLGLDFGPYIGVMLNAFIMGIAGSLTVLIAKEIYGNDAWRMKRVGNLFAFCGSLIMFGAVLIRDCFTTLLNVIVLWIIIRWLIKPTLRNTVFAIIMTIAAALSMAFFRIEEVVLFIVYWTVAFVIWFIKSKIDKKRLIISTIIISLIILLSSYILNYIQTLINIQTLGLDQYNDFSTNEVDGNSLGMRMIINQPLPIRLTMGTLSMMVYPLPIWSYFKSGISEYYLFKGYNGIYQIVLYPLIFVGIITVFKTFIEKEKIIREQIYLIIYSIINLSAVVATSLESRHLAQYMPAMIILAAIPDVRNKEYKKKVKIYTTIWLIIIVVLHLIWLALKK